jgi:hypothetical protein
MSEPPARIFLRCCYDGLQYEMIGEFQHAISLLDPPEDLVTRQAPLAGGMLSEVVEGLRFAKFQE